MKLNLSEKLLLLAAILALIHHTDHVLRVDHSGTAEIVSRNSALTAEG